MSELQRRTRRGFLGLGAGAAAGYLGWHWLRTGKDADGIPIVLRRAHQFNERVTGALLFDHDHRAPEFPLSAAEDVRVNGDIGMDDELEDENWRLKVISGPSLSLAEIRALPRTTHTTELHCVEGWSTVVNWSGVSLKDFTDRYASRGQSKRYAGLMTPSKEYFVGLDMPSAMHPQTLLCYEMNGQPLTAEHGAPLRLVTPVKYGIKNIKRIKTIDYTDERPADYWAERGYDYYAAL